MIKSKDIVFNVIVIIMVVFLIICCCIETGNERTQFSGSPPDKGYSGSQDPPELPFQNRQFQPALHSETGPSVADGTLFFGHFHEYLYFLEKGPSPEK